MPAPLTTSADAIDLDAPLGWYGELTEKQQADDLTDNKHVLFLNWELPVGEYGFAVGQWGQVSCGFDRG